MGKLASWHENDRIRREGTHNLVEAALAEGGVHVFIYPSFALVYPDSGDKWIDADIGTTPAMGGRALPGLVEKQSMPE